MREFIIRMKINPGDLIRKAGAGVAAVLTYLFGGADKWITALIVFMIMDYITGLSAAFIHHEVNSRKGLPGILKKVLMSCVVAVANIIDDATGAGGVLRSLTIGFLLANEGISILENCGRCGIKFPKKLLDAFEQIRNSNGGNDDDDSADE